MPTLQVRNLPDYIYRKLKEKAAAEHRSIAQQTIILLQKALEMKGEKKDERDKLINRILQSAPIAEPTVIPDPVELIREDRDR